MSIDIALFVTNPKMTFAFCASVRALRVPVRAWCASVLVAGVLMRVSILDPITLGLACMSFQALERSQCAGSLPCFVRMPIRVADHSLAALHRYVLPR